ncbi:hypothetical protein AVEN_52904-1 [Araneus ventricosus]|uniref:Uncharacterized protein n=1 Tax=Araneus ventricosus TaxID=182803 RepID=A0A4Y2FGQ3_ARAVE|nr:hypothetical protein AVEN_52904-1 [Araneus ventricosus]
MIRSPVRSYPLNVNDSGRRPPNPVRNIVKFLYNSIRSSPVLLRLRDQTFSSLQVIPTNLINFLIMVVCCSGLVTGSLVNAYTPTKRASNYSGMHAARKEYLLVVQRRYHRAIAAFDQTASPMESIQ